MLARHRLELHLLKLNGGGHPAHPLYLPATLAPKSLLTKSPGTNALSEKSVT